jgi:hypothetical protein
MILCEKNEAISDPKLEQTEYNFKASVLIFSCYSSHEGSRK